MRCFSRFHSEIDDDGDVAWKRHRTKRTIVKMMPLRTKRGRPANIVVALYRIEWSRDALCDALCDDEVGNKTIKKKVATINWLADWLAE